MKNLVIKATTDIVSATFCLSFKASIRKYLDPIVMYAVLERTTIDLHIRKFKGEIGRTGSVDPRIIQARRVGDILAYLLIKCGTKCR